MKKLLCGFFAVILILSLTVSSAMAASFSLSVQCTSASGALTSTAEEWDSTTHSGMLYVYHSASDGKSYTNMFKVRKNGSNYGSAWCRPWENDPVYADIVVPRQNYGIAARGNTNHYENDGIARTVLSGTYGWPK